MALLAAVSCSKSIDEVPAVSDAPVFTAYATSAKTTLSGLNINWVAGDEISIFNGDNGGDGYGNARYKASSVTGSKASFALSPSDPSDLTATATVSEYAAIYPFSAANAYDKDSKVISYALPATQSYAEGSFSGDAFPMVALSANESLSFSGVCGVLRLKIKGSATITSIQVDGKKIAGAGSIDLNEANPVLTMGDGATNTVTYDCGSGVALNASEAKSFDIVLPTGSYTGLTLTIKDNASGSMSITATGLAISTNTITSSSITYAVGSANDLSADGYANCYVVNGPGKYSFECVIPDATSTVASGVSAKWVWATSGEWASEGEASAETLVKDVTYDSGTNTISFTVPGVSRGNVLIALLDGSNNISYGWHIWLTPKINTTTVGGVEFMDRNLGAAGAVDVNDADINHLNNCLGLNYQWGRKDPHAGPRGFLAASESTAFTPGSTTYTVYNEGINNVAAWKIAAFTPDGELDKTVAAGQFPTTLCPSGANYIPGYGVKVWPDEADPCPAGYHVPTRAEMNVLTSMTVEKNTENELIANAVLNEAVRLPICGYRNTAKAQTPKDGRYWAKDHESTNAQHGYWYQVTASTSKITSQTANEIHSAFVRCVKD